MRVTALFFLQMIQHGVSDHEDAAVHVGRVMDWLEARLDALKAREEERQAREEEERIRREKEEEERRLEAGTWPWCL